MSIRRPHHEARETQDLSLSRCTDGGDRSQETGEHHRYAYARPVDGVIDDVTGAHCKAPFKREPKVLWVDERVGGDKLWSWHRF
jgi:hypothetical protein